MELLPKHLQVSSDGSQAASRVSKYESNTTSEASSSSDSPSKHDELERQKEARVEAWKKTEGY